MAKTEVKSTAPVSAVNRAGFDFGDKEQINFPPYWKPVVGKSFVAMPMFRDDREPKFIRYHLIAYEDMPDCMTGPVDGAEPAPVKKGEFFTLGKYAALPLDFFMGLQDPCLITCEGTRPSKEPNDTFMWSIRPTARDKKTLAARRADPNTELPPGMARPRLSTPASAE